jgi:uncharacterized protein
VTVVFDSGIWISAMQFRGTPFEAVLKGIADDRIVVCRTIEDEIVRVLTQKFEWEQDRVYADLRFYWKEAIEVQVEGKIRGICRDPKDEPILECAERAQAGSLVSGDKDLLSLGSYAGIQILTARQYLERPGFEQSDP